MWSNFLVKREEFARFCAGLGAPLLSEDLLDAARRDGLLVPIARPGDRLAQYDDRSDAAGVVPVTCAIECYSPYQSLILKMITRNELGADGRLVDPNHRNWRPEGRRIVYWGGNTMWGGEWFPPQRGHKKIEEIGTTKRYSTIGFCEDYWRLIRMVHALRPASMFEAPSDMRRGDYRAGRLPVLFDLAIFKINGEQQLKLFGLSLERLRMLRRTIGQDVQLFDPLKAWHYYIQRHPWAWRDELEGDARLAQEIYVLCDIINSIIEAITGKKDGPLLEVVSGDDFGPSWPMPALRYVDGTDVAALKDALSKFRDWIQRIDNAEIKKKLSITSSEVVSKLEKIASALDDFEQRYGSLSFGGGFVRMLDDTETKSVARDVTLAALRDDANMGDALTDVEHFNKDGESEVVYCALEKRLGDIASELSAVFGLVLDAIRDHLQQRRDDRDGAYAHRYKGDNALTERERKKFGREVRRWDEIQREVVRIAKIQRLKYCSRCRNVPVPVRALNAWSKIQPEYCDECLSAVQGSGELQGVSRANSWFCGCGRKLYQFVYANMLSSIMVNGLAAKIELQYGKARIFVTCKHCKNTNTKELEYGWLPNPSDVV